MNSTKWRRLRHQKLTDDPLCAVCLREGRTTLAEEVHHIAPIETAPLQTDAVARAYDYDNLMSVCRVCHKAIHSRSEAKIKKNTFLESLKIGD